MAPLLWNAPPPSYWNEPSTTATDAAACIDTAPLRLRVIP